MTLKKLKPMEKGSFGCPVCGKPLRFVDGGAVRVVDGKVDMENTKPKYECDTCGVFYREVLSTGYFDVFPLAKRPGKKKKIRATGDLQPVQLKRNAAGTCPCPRCGADMRYVEGQPVRIVNGKPDMDNVLDHFICGNCSSVYRRIVNTDYFQWTEK